MPPTTISRAPNGIRVIFIEEFVERGAADVMAEARAIAGERPTYVSFDIDVHRSVDGARHRHAGDRRHHHARGAGDGPPAARRSTSSAPTSSKSRRRSILGGMTALAGATMMFELLCVVAERV